LSYQTAFCILHASYGIYLNLKFYSNIFLCKYQFIVIVTPYQQRTVLWALQVSNKVLAQLQQLQQQGRQPSIADCPKQLRSDGTTQSEVCI
jgi:hypothetical protein